jgi:hypothetical protein
MVVVDLRSRVRIFEQADVLERLSALYGHCFERRVRACYRLHNDAVVSGSIRLRETIYTRYLPQAVLMEASAFMLRPRKSAFNREPSLTQRRTNGRRL